MPDIAAAFRGIRQSLTEELMELDGSLWDTPIPIRSEWSVKDTLAMLAGFAEALIEGHWNEDYSDSWDDKGLRAKMQDRFQTMIDARRERSGAEVLKEWATLAPRMERMMAGLEAFPEGIHPFAAWTYLWAVVQNSHNIWTALGITSKERDSEATSLCLESAIYWLDMRLQAKGIPALRVRTADQEWVIGDGIPGATVTAPMFELFRALSGRRSVDQIRAFSWDGDPRPYLAVFSPFEPPVAAIIE
ncbi:MAG TPA: hypothetical protein VJ922_04675 [Actinomycetota bacterium]|nr:hypothetical protein [Actinomycetota bacterium]